MFFSFSNWVVSGGNECRCSDLSDEQNCDEKNCEPWMFACGDGRCIYNTWKCGNYHSFDQICLPCLKSNNLPFINIFIYFHLLSMKMVIRIVILAWMKLTVRQTTGYLSRIIKSTILCQHVTIGCIIVEMIDVYPTGGNAMVRNMII